MRRTTVMATLVGALLALAIVGGFMALDRTVLHWYVETEHDAAASGGTPSNGITATEAEAYAVDEISRFARENPDSWIRSWQKIGYRPECSATEQTGEGWWVQCDLRNAEGPGEYRQAITAFVDNDGNVTRFP